jgi:membrane-bound metal-dependent hydrolase YbcI (DUF457 family)
MPLTPFHLGPALVLALVLLSLVDLPALLLGSISPDIEPAAVWFLDLPFPLHGLLHSFVGGTLLSLVLAALIFPIRKYLETPMRFLKLYQNYSFSRMLGGALIGIYSHILFDASMHGDMKPFWPLDQNPFLSGSSFRGLEIDVYCMTFFFVALVIYGVIWVRNRKKNNQGL